MKVLHVLRDLSCNGGVQRLVFDIVTSYRKENYPDVLITNTVAEADYIESLTRLGVSVKVIPKWQLFKLWRLFRQYDLVHAHLFPAIYLVGFLKKKSVYTEHNTSNNRRKLWWSRPFERFIYRQFHTITCISEGVQSELLKFLSWRTPRNTIVMHNGVNLDAYSQCSQKRESSRANNFTFNIGMVGSLTNKKDQATLIRALAKLPDDSLLHLAGMGSEHDSLQQLAVSIGVVNRVIFHGLVTDIPDFLSKMDVYVQSSVIEGFGLAAIEAMASELPVLCSDVPGLNNLCDKNIHLFQQGNTDELYSLLLRVNTEPVFRHQLLKLSNETAEKYSLQRMLSQLDTVYQSVIFSEQAEKI